MQTPKVVLEVTPAFLCASSILTTKANSFSLFKTLNSMCKRLSDQAESGLVSRLQDL